MNRPGRMVWSGSVSSVGTSYTTVTLSGDLSALPALFWVREVHVTLSSGTATKARFRVQVSSNTVLEYDDPDVPGDPVTLPLHFADPAVRIDGTPTFQVAADTTGNTLAVSVEIETL